MRSTKQELSPKQREELLAALKARFAKNLSPHNCLEYFLVSEKSQSDGHAHSRPLGPAGFWLRQTPFAVSQTAQDHPSAQAWPACFRRFSNAA